MRQGGDQGRVGVVNAAGAERTRSPGGGEFVTRGENGDTDAAHQKFSMSERGRHADPFRSEYQPRRHDNAARLHFFPLQTKIGAGFDFIVRKFNPRLAGIIGRFGIGFYSVFMVAKKVEVTSVSATGDGTPHVWTSDGTGSFTLRTLEGAEAEGIRRGTSVKIFLRDDAHEYEEKFRLESVIRKHSTSCPCHSAGRFPHQHHGGPVARAEVLHHEGTVHESTSTSPMIRRTSGRDPLLRGRAGAVQLPAVHSRHCR